MASVQCLLMPDTHCNAWEVHWAVRRTECQALYCAVLLCRIRPQSARERIDLCRVCTVCTPGIEQVVLGKDKAFTYDHVYDMDTQQESLYKSSAENLVERLVLPCVQCCLQCFVLKLTYRLGMQPRVCSFPVEVYLM